MGREYEGVARPDEGAPIEYNGELVCPERPIVPIVYGTGRAAVQAARRVLDAAAGQLGRRVAWLHLDAGDDARDQHGTHLPEETVAALEAFRVGLVGPLGMGPDGRHTMDTLREVLDLHANLRPCASLAAPSPPDDEGGDLDMVLFQEATEDVAAGIEFPPGTAAGRRTRRFLAGELGPDALPDGPLGLGVRPVSRHATERLVETTVEYALDRDRRRLTVVHQGDLAPATDGSFRDWALAYLDAEYGDAVVTEAAFRSTYDGTYPEDELVVDARQTTDVCRRLVTDPRTLDVLVAPALGGVSVGAVAEAVVGGPGFVPVAALGEARMLAGPQRDAGSPHGARQPVATQEGAANPIATILSGCLLFEFLGWDDAAALAREAVEATLADGLVPHNSTGDDPRERPVTAAAFADRVVEHVAGPDGESRHGWTRTTPEERRAITDAFVGLYNAVFDDELTARDVRLTTLRGADEEAEIHLPEVGVNVRYWRRWSVERRLEVLLHELAHVENYDDDHAPSFYERLVELTDIAEDWQPELEATFGAPIDFERVKRHVVESVHEETIEPDLETVADRKRALRDAFGIHPRGHY